MTINYRVEGMRVILPKNRKDENVALTVKGIFYDSNDGRQLSFKSKDISRDQVANPEFAIDLTKGILTLPAGRRGKPTTKGVTKDELDTYLKSLKGK